MKKTLLIALCLLAFLNVQAQETTFSYNFDNNSFDGWSGYDADGDGYTWELHNSTISGGFDGSYGLYSSCYMNGPLTPDNYLYTTETYLITENSILHFFHCQSDIVYFQENFGVIISEDGINFTEIWSKEYTEPYPNDKWGEEYIDLSEYAGKNLYIGFRHHDCNGNSANGIRIDNVELTSVESVQENEISFNIYPNPASDFVKISVVNSQLSKVRVYNNIGVLVDEIELDSDEVEINISDYSTGVYFFDVDGKIVKIIKN